MKEDVYMSGFLKHFFGLRKIKSLIALAICFCLWQLIRIPFSSLEIHPIYAYFYAILEMRNSIEMQKRTSLSRVKANIIGYVMAFCAIALNQLIAQAPVYESVRGIIQFLIISLGVLLSLNFAELFKCTTLCAIAATTFIICFWHTDTNPYLYATLRFIQTLLAVGIAYLVNTRFFRPEDEQSN